MRYYNTPSRNVPQKQSNIPPWRSFYLLMIIIILIVFMQLPSLCTSSYLWYALSCLFTFTSILMHKCSNWLTHQFNLTHDIHLAYSSCLSYLWCPFGLLVMSEFIHDVHLNYLSWSCLCMLFSWITCNVHVCTGCSLGLLVMFMHDVYSDYFSFVFITISDIHLDYLSCLRLQMMFIWITCHVHAYAWCSFGLLVMFMSMHDVHLDYFSCSCFCMMFIWITCHVHVCAQCSQDLLMIGYMRRTLRRQTS